MLFTSTKLRKFPRILATFFFALPNGPSEASLVISRCSNAGKQVQMPNCVTRDSDVVQRCIRLHWSGFSEPGLRPRPGSGSFTKVENKNCVFGIMRADRKHYRIVNFGEHLRDWFLLRRTLSVAKNAQCVVS